MWWRRWLGGKTDITGIGNNKADFETTYKKEGNPHHQKLSLMSIITAITLGLGTAMLALNYYHASTCVSNSPDEKEAYINAIGHRLETVERRIQHNTASMEKLVSSLQAQLIRIDAKIIDLMMQESQTQAIKIALELSEFPPPIMPDSIKYKYDATLSSESGGEKSWGDDKWGLGKEEEGKSGSGIGSYASKFDDVYAEFGSKNKKNDDKTFNSGSSGSSSAAKKDEAKFESLTDSEAVKQCTELKDKFSVIPGVSWGNLPYDQQQRWLHYSCDYHLAAPSR